MRVDIIFVYHLILIYEKVGQVKYKMHENLKMIPTSKFFTSFKYVGFKEAA